MIIEIQLPVDASKPSVLNPGTSSIWHGFIGAPPVFEQVTRPILIEQVGFHRVEPILLQDALAKAFARDPQRQRRFDSTKARVFSDMSADVRAGKMSPIRFARIKASVDQWELARRIGMRASNLSRLERPNSNPRVATLRKIAKALSINIEELVHE